VPTFEPGQLAEVAQRDDALGLLARRFASMADEVRAREERLRREVRELRIEIDHARQAQRVAEITDTDFFRELRARAGELRSVIRSTGAAPWPADVAGAAGDTDAEPDEPA
jgi:two-component system, cell cycle response regulator